MKHIKLFEDFLNEATPSEIIKDLDKVRHDLIKKVDVLIAKKKKLYSNIDIESPMSADEKELEKDIQSIFSQIQQIIQQKRKLKESVNEAAITSDKIKQYYSAICKAESVDEIPLRFESVKFGGASTTYNPKTNKALYISFDVSKMHDVEYAILHELTHQIKLQTEGDPYLGKKDQSAKFKKLENAMIDKYMYSSYSNILWK
jgi:hypothetical protein